MKNKINIIITIIFVFIANLLMADKVFAATLKIDTEQKTFGIGEQFYVDLSLDTKGQSINAISGSLIFPSDAITFIRAEEGKSIINLWIDRPEQAGDLVSFSGVIPNGFNGVIDPFNPNDKIPGLLVRLIFETKKSGQFNIDAESFYANLNDGLGTEITIPKINGTINIGDFINKKEFIDENISIPEIEAYITRDPNLFDNKYTLIFNAKDKETGIKNVMIKEGNREWNEVRSPYLLIDQSRHSTILLKATNYSLESTIFTIDKIPYKVKPFFIVTVLILIIIILSFLIFRKIHGYKKNKK